MTSTIKPKSEEKVEEKPAAAAEEKDAKVEESQSSAADEPFKNEILTQQHSEFSDTPQFQFGVVVAIDFGTTFSGYAYSFTHDPENIHIMRKWEGNE